MNFPRIPLFSTLVGSQAYGTATPTSDFDKKGVFHASSAELLGTKYKQQIDHTKDHVDYELKRFLELLCSANPTVLEMLFSPDECVEYKHPVFDEILKHRHLFLTKKCRDSFGGYAVAQLRKARGLEKKFNWENNRTERKEPIDFCYLIIDSHTYKLTEWLEGMNIKEEELGLINLDHAPHCYAMFLCKERKYNGIFAKNSDYTIVSSIPKGEKPIGTLVYNKDSFQIHRKEWTEYQTWLAERNTQRYVDLKGHGQKVDGKHLLHLRRLLDVALEIPVLKTLKVRRDNADYLLSIRRGEVNLEDIIKQGEEDIEKLNDLYKKSDLPDSPPDIDELLIQVRHKIIQSN